MRAEQEADYPRLCQSHLTPERPWEELPPTESLTTLAAFKALTQARLLDYLEDTPRSHFLVMTSLYRGEICRVNILD